MSFPLPWKTVPRPSFTSRVGVDQQGRIQTSQPQNSAVASLLHPSVLDHGSVPVGPAAGAAEAYAADPRDLAVRRKDYAAGYDSMQGYLQNPLEEEGREAMAYQFLEAPLGGHVRSAAEGLGLEADHALMAERGLAGLTAVGIGVPAFMAAVQQLSTPADQNTIPL